MSFTTEVKEEIITHSFSTPQKRAFLAGFVKQNGELIFANQRSRLQLSTVSNRVARNLIAFTKDLFPGEIVISIIQGKTLKRKKIYQLNLVGDVETFLELLSINFLTETSWGSQDSDFWRAYVAGLFIASGSLNSPKAKNYHLEIPFKTAGEAQAFSNQIHQFGFPFHLIKRSPYRWVAYLKSAPKISDFLKFLDAHQAVWDFENKRIARDISNNINRIQNIDISNQTKTLEVGQRQVAAIHRINRFDPPRKLSPRIQLMMKLRVEYPEATYQELAEKMTKRGYNITKAGVNSLLRQIQRIAQGEASKTPREQGLND